MKKTIKKSSGFSLVEIVIVIAIVSIAMISIISYLIFMREVNFKMARYTEATTLAEEGMEAVRKLRNESWAGNIGVLAAGTTYYPVINANRWTLSLTNPGLVNNKYTRTVVVQNTSRDANGNIGAGTADPDTKKLTITVSWKDSQQTKNVVLTTYITNFTDN
jgi:prepilin-type N-terminal cleavage/methylation domain-containing protein